jgi:dinuclear metal center YbgI/SA1388 family protein
MLTVADAIKYLEAFAPKHLAGSWDNVGLLVGDRFAPVERIMTCLTVTPESAAEAVEQQAQLIVTHHPVLFRPVQRLTGDTSEGRMLLSLIRGGVAVYSPHTAFDNTRDGINELLGSKLGLQAMTPLRRSPGVAECKIVVFVPDADLSKVSDAMFAAGAGVIGQYRECSYRLAGTGTFFGTDGTNPTVGQKARREEVSEWRLEVVCPEAKVEQTITAMRKSHSYEEPAFDVYPLRAGLSPLGDGRTGTLREPTSLGGFVSTVKHQLNCGAIQLIGDPQRTVSSVAIVCGAGGELLKDAIRARVDVFLTGEMRFHDYLTAQAEGLSLILPGHYATERIGVEALAVRLQNEWRDVQVWASRKEKEPVTWIS